MTTDKKALQRMRDHIVVACDKNGHRVSDIAAVLHLSERNVRAIIQKYKKVLASGQ